MTVTPFTQNNPQGTHFKDGVRVGPIYGTSYSRGPGFNGAGGGNFATPIPIETPADQLSNPGVLLGPTYTYFITPYASSVFNGPSIADIDPGVITTARFLTLGNLGYAATFRAYGVATVPLPSPVTLQVGKDAAAVTTTVTNGYVLDVPRCVSVIVTDANNTNIVNLYAFGYDAYGFPVVSKILLSTGVFVNPSLQMFPKAMKVLLGIYINGPITNTSGLVIGTSDVFGLPYRVDNQSCISGLWNGVGINGTLGNPVNAISIRGQDGTYNTGMGSSSTVTYNLLTASPAPFATGNTNTGPNNTFANPPLASATSNDVRGLFGVGSVSNFRYDIDGGIAKAKQLVMQMYLPGANSTSPQVYKTTPPNENFPSTLVSTPAIGNPALAPVITGGVKFVPLYGPNLPVDLYGSPQYNTDVPGTPFMVTDS